MPQMMPMNWLILFILFSFTLTLFSIMNYYIFNYNTMPTTLMETPNPKSLNWKW
uniref:ATP synthase complex subunit 8 n=1 Tax=Tettigonia chinensis TaxID=469653 RepID=A0A1Q1MPK7_9ORTH|nr:ATP synthase F0 subunit 8 [Tettigonia chinensis]